jgi:chaperonin GroEL (HSP60 family)
MDKMITTGTSTTISNDGATVLKLLDIVHPAAKVLVDIAKSQVLIINITNFRTTRWEMEPHQ